MFNFQIGQRVITKAIMEMLCNEMSVMDITPRLEISFVTERISVECVGGTQLFYNTVLPNGLVARQPEDALMSAEAAFPIWREAFQAQYNRVEEKKKGRL